MSVFYDLCLYCCVYIAIKNIITAGILWYYCLNLYTTVSAVLPTITFAYLCKYSCSAMNHIIYKYIYNSNPNKLFSTLNILAPLVIVANHSHKKGLLQRLVLILYDYKQNSKSSHIYSLVCFTV